MFSEVIELLYTGVRAVFGWFDSTLVAVGAFSSVFGLVLFIAAWRIFIQPLFGNLGSTLHSGTSDVVDAAYRPTRTNTNEYFELPDRTD